MAQDDLTAPPRDGNDENAAGRGGNKKKLVLFILLPLLLVAGIGAGAFFSGVLGGDKTASQGGEAGAGTGGKQDDLAGPIFYDLDQIVIDLNASGKRRSYLQMRLSLEIENAADIPLIEKAVPFIMDDFLAFLRELRLEDLQGTAGMYRVREELLIRVNNAAAPARVQNILFKEILIQ